MVLQILIGAYISPFSQFKSRNILKDLEEIRIIEFDHNDVVRHPLVSKIIRAYQNKSTDDKD